MMMASPSATSAAATAMTNNTVIWPSIEPRNFENATKVRFTAFNMSSIAMKMMRALRLITTPITPMAKRAALRIRYALKGTVPVLAPRPPPPAAYRIPPRTARPPGQYHRPNDGDEEDDGGDVEGDQELGEQETANELGIPDRTDIVGCVMSPDGRSNTGPDGDSQLKNQKSDQAEPQD